MTNQDKISALGKAVAEIKTLAMDARTLATDNSMDGANTVAQDFEIVVRSLELPYLQLLEALEHTGKMTDADHAAVDEKIAEQMKNIPPQDKLIRPSPMHVFDGKAWVLPTPPVPANVNTPVSSMSDPTHAQTPGTMPQEAVESPRHEGRVKRMAGTF
jgi:hypothetical protein